MRFACAVSAVFVLCFAAGCSKSADTTVEADSRQAGLLRGAAKVLRDARAGDVIDAARADLDNDGTVETVAITCRRRVDSRPLGGEIVVLQTESGKPRVAWRQPKLNPWKVRIADVDGDGEREIVAGVWKKSPKDQVMAKRVFVYSWNGERMLPKWLGSRLSRRFDDFTMADVNDDGWDELVALETAPGGKHRVSVYRWRCFGFDWLGCSDEVEGLTGLRAVDGKLSVDTREGQAKLEFVKDKVVIEQ